MSRAFFGGPSVPNARTVTGAMLTVTGLLFSIAAFWAANDKHLALFKLLTSDGRRQADERMATEPRMSVAMIDNKHATDTKSKRAM